jgi:hypothetical protein
MHIKQNKEGKNSQERCVYYFFNCKDYKYNNEKRKPIHKTRNMDFFLMNELTNSKKIHTIKDYKYYYYVYETSSELKLTEFAEDVDCVSSGEEIKSDGTVLLKFEDRRLIYLKNYLKTLSDSTKYIYTIIDFYKRLLKSIGLLVNHQIVHNHINFDTIVIDNNSAPLLSEFSVSIDTSRKDINQYISHFFIEYDPSYLEWPLEIHILSYLITNKLTGPQHSISSYNIDTIICNFLEHNNILKTFGDKVVSSYKQEALEYCKKYVNKSYDYILTDILQYSNTWDNYALSIMFLRILIGIHRSIGKQNKFIIMFMKLLVCNIHLNPLKRLSIGSTTNKFDSILDSLEPKDYKEVLDNLLSA